jgi:type IV secretion system protein VirB8
MSDIAFIPETVPAEMRQTLFAEVISFRAEERRFDRDRRHAGWWIGGIGAAIGVLGMVCAASVLPLKQPPKPIYLEVDRSTGWVGEVAGAADAPKLFTDGLAERALREYIQDRESYVWQTDDQAFHLVALESSPDEQKRYAEDRRQHPPSVTFGRDGYARCDNWHFTRRGNGKDSTIEYEVRFYKTETKGGAVGLPQPWTALVALQFHPELTMSSQDRLINPAGLQVVSYSSFADHAP